MFMAAAVSNRKSQSRTPGRVGLLYDEGGF